MNSSVAFGGAPRADLASSVTSLPPAGIGPAFSFERAAGRALEQVRRVCKMLSINPDVPAYVSYVFCDDLEKLALDHNFDIVNAVWTTDDSIGFSDIENRVILLSRNGGAGCRSKIPFAKMSEHGTAINDMSLQLAPALIFQVHTKSVTLYPRGIAGDVSEHRSFGDVSQLLIGNTLQKTLDRFDDTWLNAPLGHATVWADVQGHTHVPAENTEKRIQDQLHLALMMADEGSLVMQEIPNSDGRADLLLWSQTHRVVLELKVLRSYSFPKTRKDNKVSPVPDAKNEESALEVVKQAHSYRKRFTAQRACARLYDMRKPPANPAPRTKSTDLAKSLSVELWISDVHFSAKEKRDAAVAAELAAILNSSHSNGDE